MIWRSVVLVSALISGAVAAEPPVTASSLGLSFIEGSTSTLWIERGGRKYLVDLNERTIRESAAAATSAGADPGGKAIFQANCATCHGAGGKGKPEFKTPDFTDPKVQASFTDDQIVSTIKNGKKGTAMPSWSGKLTDQEISAVASYVRSLGSPAQSQLRAPVPQQAADKSGVYTPGDDWLMSLPTGRPVERHGLTVNFTHRFAFDPAFSGPARGSSLFGLDGVAISSFGFRYGVTSRLSVSAYRSPSLIARPIQLMAAYNVSSESTGSPVNAAVRFSVEGEDNFSKNFTENFELVLSRSITSRAQLYFVPTVSIDNRRLILPSSFRSGAIPGLPGYNTFSAGVGASVDVRPTVALLAEVIPTLANGRPLGIHRPAYSFGIQKKIWRHAFTFGFSNSPGTTVSQRAGTRASYLGDPGADKPAGMFVSFDLMRQLR